MALPVVWETDSSCRAMVVVEAGARGAFSVQKNNTGYTRESLAIFFIAPDIFIRPDLVCIPLKLEWPRAPVTAPRPGV
jgi:hypothetical protein